MKAALNMLSGKSKFSASDVSNLQGRTAVITGGTDGIGFEVARALALAQARVILLSREGEQCEDAISKIKKAQLKETGPLADVTFIECDLGNLQHVKKVGDQIREQEPRLDLLICVAGIGVNKSDVSAEGLDCHFMVNHLGHFLLTNRLLPLIRRTAARDESSMPRIICVSSSLHAAAPSSVRFASREELTRGSDVDSGELDPTGLYARSKLANILFVKYGLVERVLGPAGDRVLALTTHPGAVHTGQQDQFKDAYGSLFENLMKHTTIPFMRSPEQGSASTLWAATSEVVERDAKKWQGKYITDPEVAGQESAMACDEELGGRLWNLSEDLVKEKLGDDSLLSWGEGNVM
ncbi:hypothetical protein BKA93DRAFT_85057 [Sparassis latifolia]